MRALPLARLLGVAVALLAGCSFTIDTSDLAGGAPRSDAGTDAPSCDKTKCGPPQGKVVPLASIAPCTNETTDTAGCRAKIHDACVAADPCCFTGGFGPVDFPNAEEATIMCLVSDTYTAPLSEFVVAGTPCAAASQLGSRACDAAVHASATKRGLSSALYQTNDGKNATVIGFPESYVYVQESIRWSDLTALVPDCTPANVAKQACTTAVHRYCATDGSDLSGYGPLVWDATSVTLACVF